LAGLTQLSCASHRRAGVVPNAAYRHFADRGALLQAVCASAMAQLAQAMEAEQAAVHGLGRRSGNS
jgi:AcrR family transcriptional regulator